MNTAIRTKLTPRENVTEGAMRIVEEVVSKTDNHDRSFLLAKVCDELEERYAGDSLEYHLSQMHIDTTSDILHAIDMFFVMKEMFPDSTFMREKEAVSA